LEKLKNIKAPGTDNLQAELIKYGGENIKQWLWDIIGLTWMNEKTPHEWKRGIICPLYKKGDAMEYSNYRGITLLNTEHSI
jgi:hypothetical protein